MVLEIKNIKTLKSATHQSISKILSEMQNLDGRLEESGPPYLLLRSGYYFFKTLMKV